MRIAITGATGFIGRELVSQLTPDKCVLLGRSAAALTAVFPRHATVETDYTLDSLTLALADCDAVIHLAAKLYDSHATKFTDYFDNIRITEILYDVCASLNITNIIHASTRLIYEPSKNAVPFVETASLRPSNPYAIAKFACELIAEKYRKLHIKNLRFAQIYGVPTRADFLYGSLVNKARKGKDLIVYGNGQGKRDYLYIKDIAGACIAALTKTNVSGTYNVGSNRAVAHTELAQLIAHIIAEDKVHVTHDMTKTDDMSVYLMDSSLFMKTFEWRPHFTLEEALFDIKSTLDTL